jgi:hypothetical protein
MCSKQVEGQERRTDERKKMGSGGWKTLSEPVGTEPVKPCIMERWRLNSRIERA